MKEYNDENRMSSMKTIMSGQRRRQERMMWYDPECQKMIWIGMIWLLKAADMVHAPSRSASTTDDAYRLLIQGVPLRGSFISHNSGLCLFR
jgi:hypothetical protein